MDARERPAVELRVSITDTDPLNRK